MTSPPKNRFAGFDWNECVVDEPAPPPLPRENMPPSVTEPPIPRWMIWPRRILATVFVFVFLALGIADVASRLTFEGLRNILAALLIIWALYEFGRSNVLRPRHLR